MFIVGIEKKLGEIRQRSHMCLLRQSNPYILQQRWEWTFLKVHNLLNKKTASNFFFTDILARTLRPKEVA